MLYKDTQKSTLTIYKRSNLKNVAWLLFDGLSLFGLLGFLIGCYLAWQNDLGILYKGL